MKYITGKHIVLGLLAVALVLLTGCQSDGGDTFDTSRQNPTMEMQASATAYKDVMPKASTRAGETWTPPSGFTLYAGHDDIRVAFTQGYRIAKGTKKVETDQERDAKGNFRFYQGNPEADPPVLDKWGANFPLPAAIETPYYLYGYMPAYGDLSELDPIDGKNGVNGDFANGATLTITGLPSATSSDVCVIVGVSKGSSSTNDGGIIMGQFGYTIDTGQNHVFLLCDHIYACLRLSIYVDPTYYALRRIKLKKMWVKDCKNSDGQQLTSKSDVRISLEKTNTNVTNPSLWDSPIKSIAFTNDDSNSVIDMEQNPLFYKAEGLDLSGDEKHPTYVEGFMAPIGMTEFTLVSQYDVYDTKGNLIRENETAANKININKIFSTQLIPVTEFERGTRYTLKLKVNPTYLYMLSEPDLDNPTVEIYSSGSGS